MNELSKLGELLRLLLPRIWHALMSHTRFRVIAMCMAVPYSYVPTRHSMAWQSDLRQLPLLMMSLQMQDMLMLYVHYVCTCFHMPNMMAHRMSSIRGFEGNLPL